MSQEFKMTSVTLQAVDDDSQRAMVLINSTDYNSPIVTKHGLHAIHVIYNGSAYYVLYVAKHCRRFMKYRDMSQSIREKLAWALVQDATEASFEDTVANSVADSLGDKMFNQSFVIYLTPDEYKTMYPNSLHSQVMSYVIKE